MMGQERGHDDQENKWLPSGSSHGLWQIVALRREELEFFCPTREMAFAAWNEEFDPESGFPQTATTGPADA
jgi:hypothetical protein